MFFDHYPYTNFHNVNLDWVLQAVKAWGQTVEANDRAFRDLQEANEDFKEYVTGYLQNLDVSDEINEKLDAMLAAGTLTPYFRPYIASEVGTWLSGHIIPTTPALDNTLKVANAAAESSHTGEALNDLAYTALRGQFRELKAIVPGSIAPGYRIQSIIRNYTNGKWYAVGGSNAHDGTGVIITADGPDLAGAVVTVVDQLGHANDVTYYEGFLYVCTANNGGAAEGDAPLNRIWKIDVTDFTSKTLVEGTPDGVYGITYDYGRFYMLANNAIYYSGTDFSGLTVAVDNIYSFTTPGGFPASGRLIQGLFTFPNHIIGLVAAYVSDGTHNGAITFFTRKGLMIAAKTFQSVNAEVQGACMDSHGNIVVVTSNETELSTVLVQRLFDRDYEVIPSYADLDDYKATGIYYCNVRETAGSLTHCPTTEAFTMHVDRLGMLHISQEITDMLGRVYIRTCNGRTGAWGEWTDEAGEIAAIKEDLYVALTSAEVSALTTLADMPVNKYATMSGATIKRLEPDFPYSLSDTVTYIVTCFTYARLYKKFTIMQTTGATIYYGSTTAANPNKITWHDTHVNKNDLTTVEKKEHVRNIGDVQIYCDFESAEGWYLADGTFYNNADTPVYHTNKIAIEPNKVYYMALKDNRGDGQTYGAFFGINENFLSALLPANMTSYSYKIPNADPDSTMTNYQPLYKFTAPSNAYFFSYNLPSNAVYNYKIYISNIPVFYHSNYGNLIINKTDPACAYYAKRKLCIIGPSTVMIDRLMRTGNFDNDGRSGSQFVVGFQEYLMPFWSKVDSYGYSSASYAKYDVEDGATVRSIYSRVVTDQLDISGYDDYLFVQSGNHLTEDIGTVTSYSDLGDNTTYIGALRQIIDYIYTLNPDAKIYLQTMRRYGTQYSSDSRWDLVTRFNEELVNMASILECPIIDMNQSGFNQYTNVRWCYDAPTADEGGHWNHIGSREVGLLTRKTIIGF